MQIDVKEYIKNITPKAFEELCVKYLKKIKGKNYVIRGTQYLKDGGKDIIGHAQNNIPYEIWAECKKHGRSIGLDEISKNVVLVISKGVNELIFFSTSDITATAKKHISNVASKHNFAVGFCYGDDLYREFEKVIFAKKNILAENKGDDCLSIKSFLSEYEESDNYENSNLITLHRDTIFYIDIYLKNETNDHVSDVTISFNSSNNIDLSVREYDKIFNIAPLCDRIIQIKANALDCTKRLLIPPIKFCYKFNGNVYCKTINVGTVDPSKLIHFPIVCEKTNLFLKKIEQNFIDQKNIFTVIDVRGGSGVGKTRLLDEIQTIADFNNWNVVRYDGKYIKNYRIIKDVLCNFIGIPYFTGNINFTAKEIRDILSSRGNNADFAEYIYDFVYKDVITPEILYYIEDAFLFFLKQPYLDFANLLIVDNIQSIDTQVIDFIKNILCKGMNIPAKFMLAISTNTEMIEGNSIDAVKDLFEYIDDIPEINKYQYNMMPLENNEAKILFIHALKNLEYYDSLINILVEKTGTIPFDIIMQIKYIHENNIISWSNNQWYITNFNKFEMFLKDIPAKSKNLIKKRLQRQKKMYGDHNLSLEYWNSFKLLVKYILYFRGSVPLSFIQCTQVDEDIFLDLMNSLFFKFEKEKPNLCFYHDNIFRYFSDIVMYNHDVSVAKQILIWLKEQDSSDANYDNEIMFHCLIDLRNYSEAKEVGNKILKKCINSREYDVVIYTANLLLNDSNFKLSTQDRFDIMFYRAEAYRERVDHENGAYEYYELYNTLKTNKVCIKTSFKCQFLKNAINACINSDRLHNALEILNYFKNEVSGISSYYNFIIYDRYSVIYLGLGDVEESKKNIDIAISLAEESNNDHWRSIAYSDFAYLQYRGFQNAILAKQYFNLAYDTQFNKLKYLNRRAELLQQKAFCNILDGKINDAMLNIDNCISLCDDIKNTYLKGKAMNLKGIILLHNSKPDEALHLWGNVVELCQEIKNMPCQIRAYINMGAYFLSINDIAESLSHLELALMHLDKSEFSPVHFKELFFNLVRIYYNKNQISNIYDILNKYSLSAIYEFYNLVESDRNYILNDYGILFFKGANFIF